MSLWLHNIVGSGESGRAAKVIFFYSYKKAGFEMILAGEAALQRKHVRGNAAGGCEESPMFKMEERWHGRD